MTRFSFPAALLGLSFFALTAQGQQTIQYPYNPDVDNDEYIATTDLTGFLAQFGQDFQPAPVLIDSVDLLSVIQMMQAQITALQSQVASLEASAVPGLGDYVSVDDSAHTILVSGANLQVHNGYGANWSNGLGNVIVGYNQLQAEQDPVDTRNGSHNMVIGNGHYYTGVHNLISGGTNRAFGSAGVIFGYNNKTWDNANVVLGGGNNAAYGDACAILGGVLNVTNGVENVLIGGQSNQTNGQKNVVLGGMQNDASGDHGVIAGGDENSLIGDAAAIVGGQGNSIGTDSTDTRFTAVVGGRFNVIQVGYANSIFGGISNRCEPSSFDGSISNRAIFGGLFNKNRAHYASAIFGGFANVAQLRDADDPTYYPADFLFGSAGRAFVGSTSLAGGQLINTTFGPGDN